MQHMREIVIDAWIWLDKDESPNPVHNKISCVFFYLKRFPHSLKRKDISIEDMRNFVYYLSKWSK